VVSVAAVADAMIVTDANATYGALNACSMGSGRCLFRFRVQEADVNALGRPEAILDFSLTLHRAVVSDLCLGGTCARADGGTLKAFPLRVAWSEPTVTWNIRDGALPWAAPGARGPGLDQGREAGMVVVTSATDVISLKLDPRAWPASFLTSGQTELGVVTDFFGSEPERFALTVIMREANGSNASPAKPAELVVRYCP
jgi:hypothetical protein